MYSICCSLVWHVVDSNQYNGWLVCLARDGDGGGGGGGGAAAAVISLINGIIGVGGCV